MYDFLTPRSPRFCNDDGAKLRWNGDSVVTVTISPTWLRELDIKSGDRATMFTCRTACMDSLLVAKAPFMECYGNKVQMGSATGPGHFNRTCKEHVVDALFRRHNKQFIIPDKITIVVLESNVKALALRFPEVEEYLKIQKDTEMAATQVVKRVIGETETGSVALTGSVRDENSDMSAVKRSQNGEGEEPNELQTPDCDNNCSEEICCHVENNQEESPIS
jgi:hypothetical protein